jgi:hypothetical protein
MTKVAKALRGALSEVIAQIPKEFSVSGKISDVRANPQTAETFSYFSGKYSDNHWCFDSREAGAPDVVGVISAHGCRFSCYAIPPDCRGYRTVVRLIPTNPQDNMLSTFNRDFTPTERVAFHEALAVVEQLYRSMGLIPQQHILANMAHVMGADGAMQLGHSHEPLMLHAHIVGRGIPGQEYVKGMPLICPPPGKVFDISGKGGWRENSEGNKQLPWGKVSEHFPGKVGSEWQTSMIQAIRSSLRSLIGSYAPHQVNIEVA